jgi:hypothetical protein
VSLLEKAFSNGCLVGGVVTLLPLQRVVIRVSLLFLFRLPIAEGGQDGVVGLWSGLLWLAGVCISGGLNFMMDIFDFSLHKFYLCLLELCSDSGSGMPSCRIRVWVLLGRIGKKSFKMK